jgi:hypothetical protein
MREKAKTTDQLIDEFVGLRQRVIELASLEAEYKEMILPLLECKRKYSDLFKISKDALHITSRDGKFIEVNRFFKPLQLCTRRFSQFNKEHYICVNHRDLLKHQQEMGQGDL